MALTNPRYLALVLKKVLRDLRQGWLSFGACVAMLALSVSLFLAFNSAAFSLEQSTEANYRKLKFLDFTLNVYNISQSAISRVNQAPGVAAVQGRSASPIKVLLDPPSVPEFRSRKLDGKMIGLPTDSRPTVNDIYVEKGRYFSKSRGEALLESRFAEHHGYDVGDLLRVKTANGEKRFTIVGLASSPEYVWMATNRFDPRPMDKRYGVVFVSESDAFSALGGSFYNEVHVRVSDEYLAEDVLKDVEERMSLFLKSASVTREEQPSHSLVIRDRRAFQGVAAFFPIVFLTLSSVTLFSTLWQLVSRQRRQIGILMSQGCSPFNLLSHYLILGLIVGIIGTILGVLIGIPLGKICTHFYTRTLGLPFVEIITPLGSVALIIFLALGLSFLAAWTATNRVLKLDPIKALRSEFKEGWAPRKETALDKFLPTRLKFGLRNLMRNPGRTLLSILGIAVSVAQIVMTLAIFDSQSDTLGYYFSSVHRYDFEVQMDQVTSTTALPHVSSWPETESVELCLRRPATLVFNGREVRTNVWGLSPSNDLLRLYDKRGERVSVSTEPFLFMGPVQMERLGVQPGDAVTLTLNRTNQEAPVFRFSIATTLHEPLANPPKLDLKLLQSISQKSETVPPDGINILLVKAKPGMQEALQKRLDKEEKFRRYVSPATTRQEVEGLLRMLNASKSLILAFTTIFALVVLLGTTTMNVLERTREFATLSCLGVSDNKLASLLLIETVILWFLGFLLGLPAGIALGTEMMNSFQSQLLQLDLSLGIGNLITTAVISLIVCVVALLNGLAKLKALPLTAATQDRFD